MPKEDAEKVRSEVWTFISEQCYIEAQSKSYSPSNRELADFIEPLLQARFKGARWFLPQKKTIRNRLSDMRKSWSTSVDEPFSAGNAKVHGISDEAMPAVMEVWRYCKIMDMKFTARQAKWVAQLRSVFALKGNLAWSAEQALLFARRYAAREVAVASTRKPGDPLGIDTSDLDALLVFDNGISDLLAEIERIPKPDRFDFLVDVGVEVPDLRIVPQEEHDALLAPMNRSMWKREVKLIVDQLRQSFPTPGLGFNTDYDRCVDEIRKTFNSGCDSTFWVMTDSYLTACTNIWAIWASHFVDHSERWGLFESLKNDESEFFQLMLLLSKEIAEYLGEYLPNNYTSPVFAMNGFDEIFKPSAALMERVGLEDGG